MSAGSTIYRRPDARNQRANVRIVSHVTAELPTDNSSKTFADARSEVLKWVGRRAGATLPEKARQGKPFDLKEVIGAQPVSAAAVENQWAIRLDNADTNVAQRTWITEISIWVNREQEDRVSVSCRLVCRTLGENPFYQRTVPGILRQIADNIPATIDNRTLRTSAWRVDNKELVEDLIELLVDPQRQRPVIVVSDPPYGEDPAISSYDLEDLANTNLLAAAHIVALSREASYTLTDQVGEGFSVFNGAVRTYQPELSLDADQPSAHPLAFYETIRNWGEKSEFCDFLIERTTQASLSSRYSSAGVPSFTSIQEQSAKEYREKLREQGATDREILNLAENEINELKQRLEVQEQEYGRLLADEESDRKKAEETLEEIRDEARQREFSLNERIKYLEDERQNRGVTSRLDIPDSLEDLKGWADRHLSGRVVIHKRAYRAAAKSKYDDIELVYKSLLLLRDYYVPMRRKEIDRQSFDRECQNLGIEESAAFSGDRHHEEGDTYFVTYLGRRKALKRHLKKGAIHNPRYCFRLYFFWDDEPETVVVGSLPSHLDNRMT